MAENFATPERSTKPIEVVFATASGLGFLGILGLMSLIVQKDLGGSLASLGMAVIPLLGLVAFYLLMNRYLPHPPRILLLAFLWGAFVATALSVLGNQLIEAIFGETIVIVVGAPLVEETFKGLFLLALLIFHRELFRGITSGIIYGGLVAAGFAFTENVVYFSAAWIGETAAGGESMFAGPEGLLLTFIMRGIISPFAHPLFTTAMGIAVALAATQKSRTAGFLMALCGLLVAISGHALWNGSAYLSNGGLFLLIYPYILAPTFCVFLFYCWHGSRRALLEREYALQDLAQRGYLPRGDVFWLQRKSNRRSARAHVEALAPQVAPLLDEYVSIALNLADYERGRKKGYPSPRSLEGELAMAMRAYDLRRQIPISL